MSFASTPAMMGVFSTMLSISSNIASVVAFEVTVIMVVGSPIIRLFPVL